MKRVGLVLFAMVAIALICSGSALAQGDNSTYFVTYYSNNVSGAPDATVRVINDGSQGLFTSGDLYADFYVFDTSEELITCCSCQVTPDGLLSESVRAIAKTGIHGAPAAGVIKLISGKNGFFPSRGNPEPPGDVATTGLRSWATHIQSTANKYASGPGPYSQTEAAFADSNLVAGEQSLLEMLCWIDVVESGNQCPCTPEDYDF